MCGGTRDIARKNNFNSNVPFITCQPEAYLTDILIPFISAGKIAVELFESHEIGYYDAILMDMRMPEMDGLEATRAIRSMEREDAKTIPIIALTANAFDEDVQRSIQAGLNAHLSKPVEPALLFEKLEYYFR